LCISKASVLCVHLLNNLSFTHLRTAKCPTKLCLCVLIPRLHWFRNDLISLQYLSYQCIFLYVLEMCGTFQVKITSNNDEMLRAAVEQFIDKTDKEIQVYKKTAKSSLSNGDQELFGKIWRLLLCESLFALI
jgi:hypothetical protein